MNSGVIIIFSNDEKEIAKIDIENLLDDKTNNVCFVNNASKDNTLPLLKDIQFNSNKNISIVDIKYDRGLKYAIKAGARFLLSEAEFDFIVYLTSNRLTHLESLKEYFLDLKTNKHNYNSLPTRSNRNGLKNVFSITEFLNEECVV